MVATDASPDELRVAADLLRAGRSALDLPLAAGVQAVYDAAERFFSRPEQERLTARLPFDCGYMPFGQEHSGDPAQPDQVDMFVANPRMRAAAGHIPSEPARALHEAMMPVFDVLEAHAEGIAVTIAAALGGVGTAERIPGGFRSWSLLQVNRARPLAAGRLINEPHDDGHVLTFAHADAPGLEIEVDGAFIRPTRTPHAVAVMPGHALSLLSGGRIPSLRHRVVARGDERPRTSLMFFADLDPTLCSPWLPTPFNDGIDVGAFVRGNSRRFGVGGFGSE